MNLKIEIISKVRSCIFQGEIGFPEDRKIELSILELAKENNGTSIHEIIQELKFHKVIAERLCQILVSLNYLDKKSESDVYSVTEKGIEAIEKNRLFIPQTGLWEIDWIEDERIISNTGLKILKVNPYKESKDKKDKTNNIVSPIPHSLSDLKEKEHRIGIISKYPFCEIRVIENNCQDLKEFKSNVVLEYNFNDNVGSGYLKYLGENKKFTCTYSLSDVWQDLAKVEHPIFDKYTEKGKYLISFENVNSDKKILESFRKNLSFESFIKFSDLLGEIQKVSFYSFPVFPETDQDAQKWYEQLLRDKLRDYIWTKEYEQINQSLLDKFPDRKVEPYFQQTLARDFWKQRDKSSELKSKAWFLNAPLDLDYANFN